MVSATAYFLTGFALLNAGVQAVALPKPIAAIGLAEPVVEVVTVTPTIPQNRRLARRQETEDVAAAEEDEPTPVAPTPIYTPTSIAREFKYPQEGASDVIRWKAGSDTFEKAPSIDLGVSFTDAAGAPKTTNFPVTVDTSSVGIILGAGNFGGKAAVEAMEGTPGYYVFSGDLLSIGKWVKMEVTMTGDNGPVKASPSVLAVTFQALCRGFTAVDWTDDLKKCPPHLSKGREVTYPNKSFIMPRYMGIGIGNSKTNTKEKHPIRMVHTIGDKAVSTRESRNTELFHEGYVFTREGLRVGLTNLNGCYYTRLQKAQGENLGYKSAPACVKIGGGACHQGTMSFTVSSPKMSIRTPTSDGFTGGELPDNTSVEVRLASEARAAGYWIFRTGTETSPASPITPSVVPEGTSSHVTTGSRFFKTFDLCYSPSRGDIGLRKHKDGRV